MINLPKQLVNVVFNDGGLGDQVCRVPALKYCLDHYPHVSFDVWSPDYFIDLGRHLMRGYESRCQLIPMSRMKLLLNQTLMSVSFNNDYHTTMRTHLVDHGFNIMNDGLPEIEHRNYPKLRLDEIDTVKFNLEPGSYVCLTPGYTAVVRALLPQVWNEIAAWLMGQEITPVWLGNKEMVVGDRVNGNIMARLDEEVDYSVGIDLRQQTTLLEAGKLMALSKAVVGLDNGLLHVAGLSDSTIVAAYTSVDPKIRLPYRNNQLGWNCYVIEQEESLACRYCQVNFHFLYDWDFRRCRVGTLDCVKQLTSNKFIEKLEIILNGTT